MDYNIVNGVKIPTHVRAVDTLTGKVKKSLALVVALNEMQMLNMNHVIEDPEYDLFLKGEKKEEVKEIKEVVVIPELIEEKTEFQGNVIEDLTNIESSPKPKSKGGRPSKK